jgi:hypothetical protein
VFVVGNGGSKVVCQTGVVCHYAFSPLMYRTESHCPSHPSTRPRHGFNQCDSLNLSRCQRHIPFSLRQLQYLVAVADTLSFRKAAELCNVSQPSLSAQLAELESALGVRAFERDRRRVAADYGG